MPRGRPGSARLIDQDHEPRLAVHAVALGGSAPFSATLGPGLALLIDEEGDAKTAVLQLLAGAHPPAAGAVRWCGADVAALPAAERARQIFWRDPRAPWPDVSPEQWARQLAGACPAWRADDWQAHVQGLGLAEHRHKEMFRLSTGGRRKVLLAAALASGAPLTLIDEPEAALDWPSIRYLRAALTDAAHRCAGSGRVIVVANYEPMPDVPWAQVLVLGA